MINLYKFNGKSIHLNDYTLDTNPAAVDTGNEV